MLNTCSSETQLIGGHMLPPCRGETHGVVEFVRKTNSNSRPRPLTFDEFRVKPQELWSGTCKAGDVPT